MARLNKALLIGRLGQNPELRRLTSGDAVVNLSVATNEGFYNNDGDWVDRVAWHRVVVFGRQAERVEEKMTKGAEVFVEGKIRYSKYEKNGEERYSTEIIAHTVQLTNGSPVNKESANDNENTEDDGLPF